MKTTAILFVFVFICVVNANDSFYDIPAYVGTLITNFRENGTNQCKTDFKEAIKNQTVFWRMFDSSPIPFGNGFLYSDGLRLGIMDECLKIDHYYDHHNTTLHLRGKFCTPLLMLPYEVLKKIKIPIDEIVPDLKNDMFMLSGCIPDSCSIEDVRKLLDFQNISGTASRSRNVVENCINVDSGAEYSFKDVAVILLFCVIFLLMLVSTTYEVIMIKTGKYIKDQILVAFSVYSNGRKIITTLPKGNKEQLQIFYGLKVISMMWIIAGHGFAMYDRRSFAVNRQDIAEWKLAKYAQYIYNAPLSVDTFFFISGFLVAYIYLKYRINNSFDTQIRLIPYIYLHRYLRLTPALLMLYLLNISFIKHLGSGPKYLIHADYINTRCTQYFWPFFLYIQNYFKLDKICLVHTWYLSADMQLFFISPLILVPISLYIKHNYKIVMWCLGAVNLSFIWLPFVINQSIPNYSNEYDTHSRLSIYSIGITLGVYMRININKSYPFTRKQNFVIWVLILGLMLTVFFCHGEVYQHEKDRLTKNIFYSLSRPAWAVGLAWITFSCHNGHGGFVNWILTMPVFQLASRLSYCIYLVHINVLEFVATTSRTETYFTNYNQYYFWCGHFVTSFILAFIWTLAFESPFIIIEKKIFDKKIQMIENKNMVICTKI